MSLLPKPMKIITSAPQIPENKWPFSSDPQNPSGAPIIKIWHKQRRCPNYQMSEVTRHYPKGTQSDGGEELVMDYRTVEQE